MKIFYEAHIYKSNLNNYYVVESPCKIIACRNLINSKKEFFDELGIGVLSYEILDPAIEFRYRKVWFPRFHKPKIGDICVTANKEQWVLGNIVGNRAFIFNGDNKLWVNCNELKSIKTLQREIIYDI